MIAHADIEFLPTPSARRATACTKWVAKSLLKFLPTPSARRATTSPRRTLAPLKISTHALREEGDRGREQRPAQLIGISTHALREEGDGFCLSGRLNFLISTHALREEGDALHRHPRPLGNNFYPRPPRGGRPSIAASNVIGDQFLPTPSARRATGYSSPSPPYRKISTHALREEGDRSRRRCGP